MNNQPKTELVLGTAQLGTDYGVNNSTVQTEEQCMELLKCAWDNGIRVLDTAEGYGPSEGMIGAYHKMHPENVFSVCTKLSGKVSPESFEKHLCGSIERLNVKQIDVYYMHSFSTCKDSASIDAFKDAKAKGLLDKIGISIYEPDELCYILDNLSEVVSVVQIPFSVFDCARWVKSGLLKQAKDAGLAIYARSVYLQGLLFRGQEDEMIKKLGLTGAIQNVSLLTRSHNIDLAQFAIDFVKQTEGVSALVLGAETNVQIEENARMLQKDNIQISDLEMSQIIDNSSLLCAKAVDPRQWKA